MFLIASICCIGSRCKKVLLHSYSKMIVHISFYTCNGSGNRSSFCICLFIYLSIYLFILFINSFFFFGALSTRVLCLVNFSCAFDVCFSDFIYLLFYLFILFVYLFLIYFSILVFSIYYNCLYVTIYYIYFFFRMFKHMFIHLWVEMFIPVYGQHWSLFIPPKPIPGPT